MFKHHAGWELNVRILRLHNDHYEAGMINKSEHTRNSTLYLENYVKEQIAQDKTLIWC